ncbi:hypothetical protein [Pseudomonas sp. 18175]|uniref:hypothetical protein n=1 Tax=Pseudomonas sp. 18175 TaxID=3390056 RepID=UPI003D1D842D
MLAFQQLADALGGELVEAGGALVVQAEGAAAAPGFLDKGVVSQWFGHGVTFVFIVMGALHNPTIETGSKCGSGLARECGKPVNIYRD